MFLLRYGFVLFASLFSTILAAPAPVTNTTATADATPAILTPIGPIRGPISLDVTVLSFNYYEDFECSTLLGNMNISSLDLADNKCFALPGNSLVFTYQLHDGTLSYYNPDEVNMHHYASKDCYQPPTGGTISGYMGGIGGCFTTSTIVSFQAAWGEG